MGTRSKMLVKILEVEFNLKETLFLFIKICFLIVTSGTYAPLSLKFQECCCFHFLLSPKFIYYLPTKFVCMPSTITIPKSNLVGSTSMLTGCHSGDVIIVLNKGSKSFNQISPEFHFLTEGQIISPLHHYLHKLAEFGFDLNCMHQIPEDTHIPVR